MNGITKETFKQMDADSKLAVLFDYAQLNYSKISRLEMRLNRRRKIDTACSSFFGLIGGMLAIIGLYATKVIK